MNKFTTILLRIKSFIEIIMVGFVIQFIWNNIFLFLKIEGYEMHLFEACILWLICYTPE
jgi:hypothetical protein